MICFNRQGSIKNLQSNLMLLISSWAFIFLSVTSAKRAIFALILCLITLIISFHMDVPKDYLKGKISAGTCVIDILILVMWGTNFLSAMSYSSKIKTLATVIGMNNSFIILSVVIIGILISLYFVMFFSIVLQEEGVSKHLSRIIDSDYLRKVIYCLSILGFVLAIYYSFNGYIWADESYSLRIVTYTFSDIVNMCAGDVHPPFYYIALKIVEEIAALISTDFYWTVIVGKLFSVLPYFLLSLLCWRMFENEKNIRPYVLLCIVGMPQLLHYSVEIRMYSWALLFVTSSYLYSRLIISGYSNFKNWMLLVIFSILSAYTHDFALIAMASIWLYLLIWCLLYNRKMLINWFKYGLIVAVCFFPWLLVLLRQMGFVTDSYWIEPITWANVVDYIDFMLSSLATFMPFILIIGIFGKKELSAKNVFEDGIGFLIPVTTIFVGIVVSIIVRPIFVSRYMVPALLCMWISFILLMYKSSDRVKSAIIILLVLITFNSYINFMKGEHITKIQAQQNMELFDGLEENAVIIVSKNSHVSDTVATYSSNMVYGWNAEDPSLKQTTKYREAYTNEEILNDPKKIYEWVNMDIPVYYIEVKNSEIEDTISETNDWKLEYIGDYNIANASTSVYQIVSK